MSGNSNRFHHVLHSKEGAVYRPVPEGMSFKLRNHNQMKEHIFSTRCAKFQEKISPRNGKKLVFLEFQKCDKKFSINLN